MTKIQRRMLRPEVRDEIIVSHRRHAVSLPYLPLQTGLPNEASRRMRIDRNGQFGIFLGILTVMLQIGVSIRNCPRVEKPMISGERAGFKSKY